MLGERGRGGSFYSPSSPRPPWRIRLIWLKVLEKNSSAFLSLPEKLSSDVYSAEATDLNFYSSHYNYLKYLLTKFEDNMKYNMTIWQYNIWPYIYMIINFSNKFQRFVGNAIKWGFSGVFYVHWSNLNNFYIDIDLSCMLIYRSILLKISYW